MGRLKRLAQRVMRATKSSTRAALVEELNHDERAA
jgi:hypothetical protein